ncbi:MAG: AMP-binding protein [Defluviitaleaceae bacterium]|nr:AMP-binding protein [Defluviitaleaceae bacterium]
MNILELVKSSDKIAFMQNGKSITYRELLARGCEFGGLLANKGIKKGGHVLVFAPLSIDFYIAMIGAWVIGATPIFIDFSRGSQFVNDSISRLKPDIIVCDGVTALVRLKYANIKQIPMVKVNTKPNNRLDIQNVDANHPAILTFTSGTTGQPKVAVRSHGFLINQYHILKKYIDFDENHIDFATLPVFTLANLAAGITTILPNKAYKGVKLPKSLSKITRTICSPATLQKMLASSTLPLLKKVYLGGAPVYPSLLKKLMSDVEVNTVYGATEAEPIAHLDWANATDEDKSKIASGAGLLAGHPVSEIDIKITPEGEIIVTGDNVLKGYLEGIGDVENKIKDGEKIWHRTGDTGYIDDAGRLWLTGRLSQIICDEIGVLHPFAVECVLDAHFGIRGAAILHKGKRAVVIDKNLDSNLVLKALKSLHIHQVIKIKALPMDKRHNAKIDYAQLEKASP